jgi:hypothetical protein
MTDIKFADGLSIYPPNEKAPDFVKGDMVITNDFIAFFNANQKQGKLKFQLKVSKLGKLYAELNTYEKPTSIPEIKNQVRKILNPNISQEEAEILAKHRAEHNSKVVKEDYSDEISADEIFF